MDNRFYLISELQERYGLSSMQAVYERIKALKLVPVSDDRLFPEQVDKLDKLDKWLKANPSSAITDYREGSKID